MNPIFFLTKTQRNKEHKEFQNSSPFKGIFFVSLESLCLCEQDFFFL